MGADPTPFARIYRALAENFEHQLNAVQDERRRIAAEVRAAHAPEDFNDDDLDEYEALAVLGLAERCRRCGGGYTAWSASDHAGLACRGRPA